MPNISPLPKSPYWNDVFTFPYPIFTYNKNLIDVILLARENGKYLTQLCFDNFKIFFHNQYHALLFKVVIELIVSFIYSLNTHSHRCVYPLRNNTFISFFVNESIFLYVPNSRTPLFSNSFIAKGSLL